MRSVRHFAAALLVEIWLGSDMRSFELGSQNYWSFGTFDCLMLDPGIERQCDIGMDFIAVGLRA